MEQEYKYMVCTVCATYNHAPYIVDALNGFTMQETTFPVYYLITDDASTDGEPDVIKQYLADYFQTPYRTEETDDYHLISAVHKTNPNCNFIVFLLKYNHYSIKKSKLPYQAEWRDNAKYIAICEGDDYWTDPYKLQRQIEYLESHPECSMSFHAVNIVKDGAVVRTSEHSIKEVDFSANRIISMGGSYVPTPSIVVRRHLFCEYPEFRNMADVGDYPLQVYAAIKGAVHYFPEIMGCYRIHGGSWTASVSPEKNIGHLQIRIAWLKELDKYTNGKYRSAVCFSIIDSAVALYKQKQMSKKELLDIFHKVNIFTLDVPFKSKKNFVKQYMSTVFK